MASAGFCVQISSGSKVERKRLDELAADVVDGSLLVTLGELSTWAYGSSPRRFAYADDLDLWSPKPRPGWPLRCRA